MEFVGGKVTELSMRLQDAPFVDIDAMLNEVIISCKSISAAIQMLQGTAELYLQEQCNDETESAVPDEFHEIRNINHDPAKRHRKLSDAEKKYLIHLGPFQPKLNTFPKNMDIKKSAQCRFSASWCNEYPYLEYSITNDTVHCFVCSIFPSAIESEKAEDAWITGARSWHKMKGSQGKGKPEKLSQHFTSKSHKASLEDFVLFCQQDQHINLLWDKEA